MNFNSLNINQRLKQGLEDLKFTNLTEVQEQAMPLIFDSEDVIVCAQTGSGKTLSFMLPVINNILKEKERFKIKALIIVPTRELAMQIHENTLKYCKYTNIRTLAMFGGVKESYQKQKIHQGIDILIATPGRLLDFLKQKIINLKDVNYFVIDEADKMLEMGFINDVNKINSYITKQKQTLLFSATMPDKVKELANDILRFPKEINVLGNTPVVSIKQSYYLINDDKKIYLLKDIIKYNKMESVLIFCNRKILAEKVSNFLRGNNITSNYINKDKTQIERQKALKEFKNKDIVALVATDIASRGIDIDNLYYIINFDLPNNYDTYIHRIGRTARAKANGEAITLCSNEQLYLLDEIKTHNNIKELPNDKYK